LDKNNNDLNEPQLLELPLKATKKENEFWPSGLVTYVDMGKQGGLLLEDLMKI